MDPISLVERMREAMFEDDVKALLSHVLPQAKVQKKDPLLEEKIQQWIAIAKKDPD